MNIIEIKNQPFDIKTVLQIKEISFDFEYGTGRDASWPTKILSVRYRTARDVI